MSRKLFDEDQGEEIRPFITQEMWDKALEDCCIFKDVISPFPSSPPSRVFNNFVTLMGSSSGGSGQAIAPGVVSPSSSGNTSGQIPSYSPPQFWQVADATRAGNTISFRNSISVHNRQQDCCEIQEIEVGLIYCYVGLDANGLDTTWDKDGKDGRPISPALIDSQDLDDFQRLAQIAQAVRKVFGLPLRDPTTRLSSPAAQASILPPGRPIMHSFDDPVRTPVEPTAQTKFNFKPKQDMTPQEICQLLIEAGIFSTLFDEDDLNKLGAINTNLLRHFDKASS